MAKKDLVAEAEALGVENAGEFKVAELKTIIAEAQAAAPEEPPADPVPVTVAGGGPHAAHAYGTSQGVHLQLGHLEPNSEGTMEFHLASEFVLGREAALALAEEIPFASGDHHRAARSEGKEIV